MRQAIWLLVAEWALTPIALAMGYYLYESLDWIHFRGEFDDVLLALAFSVPSFILGHVLTQPKVIKLFDDVLIHSDFFKTLREKTFALPFGFSVAAGIGEELLFRGLFLPEAGIIISSIIFAVLHAVNFYFFLVALCMGMYLGLLYQHYDNLLMLIWIHFSYDLYVLWRLRNPLPVHNA